MHWIHGTWNPKPCSTSNDTPVGYVGCWRNWLWVSFGTRDGFDQPPLPTPWQLHSRSRIRLHTDNTAPVQRLRSQHSQSVPQQRSRPAHFSRQSRDGRSTITYYESTAATRRFLWWGLGIISRPDQVQWLDRVGRGPTTLVHNGPLRRTIHRKFQMCQDTVPCRITTMSGNVLSSKDYVPYNYIHLYNECQYYLDINTYRIAFITCILNLNFLYKLINTTKI